MTTCRLPDLGPTLRRWDQEQARLDQQPYMIVRSPHRDANYSAARRGDRVRAEIHDYTPGRELAMAGMSLPLTKGLQLLRTPTPEDAATLQTLEDQTAAIREAYRALARDAWYRGSPVTLDELEQAHHEVYGEEAER